MHPMLAKLRVIATMRRYARHDVQLARRELSRDSTHPHMLAVHIISATPLLRHDLRTNDPPAHTKLAWLPYRNIFAMDRTLD